MRFAVGFVGAINLGGQVFPGSFSTSSIDQMWFPAAGSRPTGESDFVVARITLTENAQGWFDYVAFANGEPTRLCGSVIDGVLVPVPEPITLLLLAPAVLFGLAWSSITRLGNRLSTHNPVAPEEIILKKFPVCGGFWATG